MTIYLNVNEQIALVLALVILLATTIYNIVVIYTAYNDRKRYEMVKSISPNWAKILQAAFCLWPAMVICKILFS
jgi:hypothetical protein